MLMWSLLLSAVILIILTRKVFEFIKFKKVFDKLPGPKISNLISGNLPIIVRRNDGIGFHIRLAESITGLTNLYRQEGLCRFWNSLDPYVFLFSAETIEFVISKHTLLDKAYSYKLFHCWLRTGLLTSTGNKWRKRRKLITPTFHYRILDEFIPIFDKNSKLFIKNLSEYIEKDWMNIIPLTSLCTLDIICETAMGIEIKSQKKNRCDYLKALHEFSNLFVIRAMKPWLFNDFVFFQTADGKKMKKVLSILHDFSSKILKERKEELRKDSETINNSSDLQERRKKEPLLDTLIKHQFQNNNFSDEDICEELDTFTFEGHDTTSMGICWALYHLGLYPDIQQKVYEELQGLFGDDKERTITTSDIKEMKYLECVLKESQRLSPSVPTVARSCTEDITINGYRVPRGCTIEIIIYALHRDPKVFPNPEIFDPDRFLPENSIGRHPFAYIPFSAGSRNCIGQKFAFMEMKVIVSRVIMNYEIKSIDPPDKIPSQFLLVLRPPEGLRLKFKIRE